MSYTKKKNNKKKNKKTIKKRCPSIKTLKKNRLDYLLFLEQKPRTCGLIPVSNLHTIGYYTYGNPKGIPHLYLHGGPGGNGITMYTNKCGVKHSITDIFNLKKCSIHCNTELKSTFENITPWVPIIYGVE